MTIPMIGVTEYNNEITVELTQTKRGRWVVDASTVGIYDGTRVDILELVAWLYKNRPDLMENKNVE